MTKSGSCGGTKMDRRKGFILTLESYTAGGEACKGPSESLTIGKVVPNMRRKAAASPRLNLIEVIHEVGCSHYIYTH